MYPNMAPEARRVLERRHERSRIPYHRLSVEAARSAFRDHMTSNEPPPSVGRVRTTAIGDDRHPSLPLRIYSPDESGPHPVVVYFHGGGWVLGDLETHDVFCRELTRRAAVIVVAVDYRRAPEWRFPAPMVDGWRAVTWVAENATYFGGDPARLAVAGDSVGGTIATSVSMACARWDGPELAHQLLLHPATDTTVDSESYDEYESGVIGSRAGMEQYWRYFLRDEFDRANPYAAPLRFPDVSPLPPARVLTCEYDPLRDEGMAYAERLGDAGVLREHVHEDDVFHGYFLAVEFMDRASEGVDVIAEGLRAALH
jgi:acetyl esterase